MFNMIKKLFKFNFNKKRDTSLVRDKLIDYRAEKSRELKLREYLILTNNQINILCKYDFNEIDDIISRDGLSSVNIELFGEDILNIIKCLELSEDM